VGIGSSLPLRPGRRQTPLVEGGKAEFLSRGITLKIYR
jgi:hypothetical protein